MMITKEQYKFLKAVKKTGKDGLKPDEISAMVGYFNTYGYISYSPGTKETGAFVIQPEGEMAMEEYESGQKTYRASAFAALFAGLLLVATVVFGIINVIWK